MRIFKQKGRLLMRAEDLDLIKNESENSVQEKDVDIVQKHFVTFNSPGSFVAEQTTKEIDTWGVEKAIEMSKEIKERYGALPYGFYFTTRSRGKDDLDSKISATSNMYYLGGEILTLEQVKARNDPKDKTLISNMECNKWNRIVVNRNSWEWTQPLKDDDVVLGVSFS